MKTGIVVSNYDPEFKNRVKIRIYGMYTEKIGDDYIIPDDDLPWVSPAPNLNGSVGSYSVPPVGSRVYVDGSGYNLVYYGPVEVKKSVKEMMYENADQSDKIKYIAVSEDGPEDFMRVYYLPENGLTMEAMGHKIVLTKHNGIKITSKEGCEMEMDMSGDINITTANNINLKCNKLNLTEGALSEETTDRIVLGSRMQEIFNNHVHFVASPGGVETTKPIEKIKETDFSNNIRISKGR